MLKNKVAIVTGGTRGIGFAVVKKFVENGAAVSVWGSRQETVDKALAQLKELYPDAKVSGKCPNLKDAAQVAETMAQVKEEFGAVDILVNNAGISQSTPLYNYTPEEFQKIVDLNITSVFNCAQAAAKIMKEQGGGVILNTSSMVSLYGQPSGCGYPASKFAVNGLTKSLARELGRDNIRVNAVAPGFIETDMTAVLPEKVKEASVSQIPLGKFGSPEQVASAVAFLASSDAAYITGQVLHVDGGMVM